MALTGGDAVQNVTIKVEEDQKVSEVKGCYIWLSESAQPNLFDETIKVSRIKRRRCAVYSCDNLLYQNNKLPDLQYLTFHRFPRDESTREIWAKLCNRTDKFSAKSSFICSDHFKKEDYIRPNFTDGKKRLKPGAMPCLKLPKIRSSRAELKINEYKSNQNELMESSHKEEERSYVDILYSPGVSDEDDLMESFQEEDVDLTTSPHSSSRYKKHAKDRLNSSVVIISSSEDENADKVRFRKGKNKQHKEIRKSLLDSLKLKYENLQRSYECLKTETDAEIKRLNNIINNKEDEFTRELKEVLSVFLKPEKVDSVVGETVW